jgi:ABC-type transporter lipoprotein component MlaA
MGMAQSATRDGKNFEEADEGPDKIANPDNPDPLEGMNRVFFAITQPIDRFILRPVAMVYRAVMPEPVRDGVHNALANIFMPSTLVNDMIQLKPKRAWQTAKRFAINSTIGIGGLVDVAKRKPFNTPAHSNGFSNTLGVAGAGRGLSLSADPWPHLDPRSDRPWGGCVHPAVAAGLCIASASVGRAQPSDALLCDGGHLGVHPRHGRAGDQRYRRARGPNPISKRSKVNRSISMPRCVQPTCRTAPARSPRSKFRRGRRPMCPNSTMRWRIRR